jgi:hypothetical protein
MNFNDDNYLIIYLLLIIIFIIIINYINSSVCNFSDSIINTPEHFEDSDILLQYGNNVGEYVNIDDNTQIYIMSNLNFFNNDNKIGKLVEYEFYSGNLSGSITPLLFELVNGNYKLVGVGTPFTPNKIGKIKTNFNLIMGTNIMERSRNYTFGWKNGTLTENNSGIVGFNNNNNNTKIAESINITTSSINTILPIVNIYNNRSYLIEFLIDLEENISPDTRTKYLYPFDDGIIIDLYGIKWRIKSTPNNDMNYTIFADDIPIDNGILIFRDSNYIVYILKKSNEWFHSIFKNKISPVPNNIPPLEYNPNYLQIINDEYKGWDNILTSDSTCGEKNVNFKDIKSPKNCIMSLYKEAGCKIDGTIFPSFISGELNNYKNMNINSIKSEFNDMSNSIYKGDDKYYTKCKANPITTIPSGSSINNNVNINNLLPSSQTCGTNLQVNINSIAAPDMCIQSLWKEAGCTSNGSLWNDISNGYFNIHSNGYWSNKTINDIKKNIENVYASKKFSNKEADLCASVKINDNNLLNNKDNFVISNDNDTNKFLVDSTFKLKVNLPNINTLSPDKNINDPNFFYLAVEQLETNCSINDANTCLNIFVDNKKCDNKSLSEISRKNSYRLVLVPIDYVNDTKVSYAKNVNFTIIKIKDKLYLKNIDTGYLPQLYKNDFNQAVIANVPLENTNIYQLPSNKNMLCNDNTKPQIDTNLLSCIKNSDGNNYLITTQNINESNTIKLNYINDKIQIKLQTYNSYGVPDNTFTLVYCNYNINTLENIEKSKLDNNIRYNLVCIDDDNNSKLNLNKLNFSIEIVKYSDEYVKKMSVISIK